MQDGVGNAETLLHTERILAEQLFVAVRKPHDFQCVLDGVRPGRPAQFRKDFKVFCAGQVRVKAGGFDDGPNAGINALLMAFDVLAEHIHFAGSDWRKAQNHFHNGGLTGSISAQKPVNPARLHMNIHRADGGLLAVNLRQLFGFNHKVTHKDASLSYSASFFQMT